MLQNDNVVYSFRGPMGVRVDIGQSIVFLVGIILFLNLRGSIVDGFVFVLILVASIFLHELGHAWGCKVQGIPVRRILLHGGGGLCERAKTGSAREQELIVAMGPLVNLALWAIAGIVQYFILQRILANADSLASNVAMVESVLMAENVIMFKLLGYVSTFAWINLILFVFNLIPVQPMDGGKLLHLFLLRVTNRRNAVRITGGVGLVASVLWIPAAIVVFLTFGFILFFFPSIPLHYAMMQGRAAF